MFRMPQEPPAVRSVSCCPRLWNKPFPLKPSFDRYLCAGDAGLSAGLAQPWSKKPLVATRRTACCAAARQKVWSLCSGCIGGDRNTDHGWRFAIVSDHSAANANRRVG